MARAVQNVGSFCQFSRFQESSEIREAFVVLLSININCKDEINWGGSGLVARIVCVSVVQIDQE